MSYPAALSIAFDHEQRRLAIDRSVVLAQGSYPGTNGPASGWHQIHYSNAWTDPITFTAMLLPAPLDPSWISSNSGIYAKLLKSSFTFTDTSKWNEHRLAGDGDWRLVGADVAGETAITGATYNRNRGIYVSFYGFVAGSETVLAFKAGWNSSASETGGVAVKAFTDGTVEIWKGGAKVGHGSINGDRQSIKLEKSSGSVRELFIDLVVLPCRRRELLVYCRSTGSGFSHVFEDISQDASDPEIVPASNIWFASGLSQASIQIAPLSFASSGYVCSIDQAFTFPPGVGEVPASMAFWDQPGYGSGVSVTSALVEPDGSTLFVPDGSKRNCKVKFSMTGDGSNTPFVYGGWSGFGSQAGYTDDSEQSDATPYASSLELSCNERADGVKLSFSVERLYEAEAVIPQIKTTSNRPVLLKAGDVVLLDGRASAPVVNQTVDANSDSAVFEAGDCWEMLDNYVFSDPMPLDGQDWKTVVEWVLETAGFDGSMIEVEDPSFSIPIGMGRTAGEFGTMIEVGDTAASWIERLFETYAGNWFYGFVPTALGIKFIASSPTGLSTTPMVTIYDTWSAAYDALIAGGKTSDYARSYAHALVYRNAVAKRILPEANTVFVTGVDPRTQTPIMAVAQDVDSIDPTTPPSSRPDNWLGEVRKYGLLDPGLTTQDAVQAACSLIYSRVKDARDMVEWDGSMLFGSDGAPIWRGSVVRLWTGPYVEGAEAGIYRVTAFRVSASVEPGAGSRGWMWRNAHYVAERVASGTPWRGRLPARDLETLEAMANSEWNRRRINKSKIDVSNRPASNISEV